MGSVTLYAAVLAEVWDLAVIFMQADRDESTVKVNISNCVSIALEAPEKGTAPHGSNS